MFLSPALQAQVTWYVDDDALPGGDGSVSHPFRLIQDGIDAAAHGDTVLVRDGTYRNTGNRDLDFSGKAITVRSENGPENCVIDCQGTEADPHRAFHFHSDEGRDSVVEGFTITNGYAYDGWPQNSGGGILCEEASPTISGNIITGNTAEWSGGGICCDHGSALITGNTISSNSTTSAIGGHAGGIYCHGSPTVIYNTIENNDVPWGGGGMTCYGSTTIMYNIIRGNTAGWGAAAVGCSASVRIMHNEIYDNTADSFQGGAITCYQGAPTIAMNTITGNSCRGIYCSESSPTIRQNIISENTVGGSGGGIFCEDSPVPRILENTITDNTANSGGGIYCTAFNTLSELVIDGNIIRGNEAFWNGGGIRCYDDVTVTIKNNTIRENSARSGGGISGSSSPADRPILIILNNIIAGNVAYKELEGYGGGIHADDASMIIINNTIYSNWGYDEGGGIYAEEGASLTIVNTILWENISSLGKEIYLGSASFPSTLDINYSDLEGGQASVFVAPGCTLNWGGQMIDAPPLFIAGPQGKYYLSQIAAGQLEDSPCVDAGDRPATPRCFSNSVCGTTRTDAVPDAGTMDMGYHHPPVGIQFPPDSRLEEIHDELQIEALE
jgi:parallel beta-helix repeat protein